MRCRGVTVSDLGASHGSWTCTWIMVASTALAAAPAAGARRDQPSHTRILIPFAQPQAATANAVHQCRSHISHDVGSTRSGGLRPERSRGSRPCGVKLYSCKSVCVYRDGPWVATNYNHMHFGFLCEQMPTSGTRGHGRPLRAPRTLPSSGKSGKYRRPR